MDNALYIAVDLGAGSGRVFLAGVAAEELLLEEVRRFHYPPRRAAGHLRWDLSHIWAEIKAGLRAAGARARQLGRPLASLGIDSWAVDYGLLDAAGDVIEDPICYRDERTADALAQVFQRVPRAEIYARTGIQFLSLNTLFQLHAHCQQGLPANAAQLLLMPDLLNALLTGRSVTEYTNATTTQLVNAETRSWDTTLLAELNLPSTLFTEIVPAGSVIGPLKPALAQELELPALNVVAPATHDTGSAVIGAPLGEDWAYISSGTWSLVGVELAQPLINQATAEFNLTNEGGAFGTIRLLKNVMGMWLLEACRKEWEASGHQVDYATLLAEVGQREDLPGLIYPDDARLFNPPSMLAALKQQLSETGQACDEAPATLTKIILDSLALRYATVLETIQALTGRAINGVQIVGGGSQNAYLNQATANATNKVVHAGPVEATVIGNVLVQAIAAERFADVREARQHVAALLSPVRYQPQLSVRFQRALKQYQALEQRYTPA